MSNSDDTVVASCDFGSLLAEARKAQSYTVEEINRQLKIPEQAILAIEANDIDALPIPTYTQGYIRSYAKFLEVSEENVLALYNRAVPNDELADLKPRSNLSDGSKNLSALIKLVTVFLAVLGIVAAIYGVFQYYQDKADDIESEFESREQDFTGNSLDSPGMTTLGIKQDARLTTDGELILENQSSSEVLEEEPAVETEVKADASVDAGKVSEDALEITDDEPVKDVLEIDAEKGSWMEVRDANNVRLFYSMVPKGGSKTLSGLAPFSVSLGNAATTRVVINDLEIDMTEHIRPNNTAKFKVSSKEQSVIFH